MSIDETAMASGQTDAAPSSFLPAKVDRLYRSVTNACARWWWSVDHTIVYCTGLLIVIGVVLNFAAGPASASRISAISNNFFFVQRHLVFLVPTLFIILGMSTLSPLSTRRIGVLVFIAAFFMVFLTLFFGPEIKGATRWLDLGLFGIQPSEFAKPGFIITSAWLLAEGTKDRSFHGGAIAMGIYVVLAFLLLMQPDYGQWLLLTAIWGIMFFIAGWSWMWIAGLGLAALGALAAGYVYAPHVASRIDRFLNPASGDTYQVDKATEALAGGGLLGHDFGGKGDGVKYQLPDSHTDFIFAVAGEEFGFVLCALIIGIFAVLVLRSFYLATRTKSVFVQCAVAGLASQIGFQAMINIGVNLQLIPTKGMTLPFISYGGSSLLATGLTVGLLLALTRRRATGWRRKEVMP